MTNSEGPLILTVDDDATNRKIIERILVDGGYRVLSADNGMDALKLLNQATPDLILLDVMMPGMDGYEVCAKLQVAPQHSLIPVLFLTALGEKHDRARGFALGAVDYVSKPIQKPILLAKVAEQLKTGARWKTLAAPGGQLKTAYIAGQFHQFKSFVFDQLELSNEMRAAHANLNPGQLYAALLGLGASEEQIARALANFLKLPYLSHIDFDEIQLDRLPMQFAKANLVVATERDGRDLFVLANPFDHELVASLGKIASQGNSLILAIAEPANIRALFTDGAVAARQAQAAKSRAESVPASMAAAAVGEIAGKSRDYVPKIAVGAVHVVGLRTDGNGPIDNLSDARLMSGESVMQLADRLIARAIVDRASDIHIEPKGKDAVVRLRIDGDMREIISIPKGTSLMLVSRLKSMGGMDIAERRRPQDGAWEIKINGQAYKLRMATTATPDGESLVMRLLEPGARARPLEDLGMTQGQVETMRAMASSTQGLILVVGPTGSGKTTTIFSMLSQVDTRSRSLISVEDPVEYRIPFANQQQVNEKAGINFESLLKSAMRQDPDILFLGEVRDSFSAKASMDFASTGHLTISTLHTSNATSAVFRLERLGVTRTMMSDSILCVVAQRLMRKLCLHCKAIEPTTQEDADCLGPFLSQVPPEVARPMGCVKCHHTGYLGREGIYETIRFDGEIAEMVHANKPAAAIRDFAYKRGDFLIGHHAAEKAAALLLSVDDVYKRVLAEESLSQKDAVQGSGSLLTLVAPSETPAFDGLAPASTSVHGDETSPPVMESGFAEFIITREPRGGSEQAPVTAPAPIETEATPAAGLAKRILLVEDDKSTQVLVRRHLESQGYAVTTADDGIDALMLLGRARFDLILSDINMPNLDGFKLLETKQQKKILTPLILLSGETDEASEIKGFEMGVADYLKKPIKKELLLLRVKKILEPTIGR